MIRRNLFTKIIAATLALLLIIPQGVYATDRSDDFIFSDPVLNTFTGHLEGAQLIQNLRFLDMPSDPMAQDAIVRSGIYNLIKGDGSQFRPGASMTIQEALAFALRAAGLEAQAITAGQANIDTLPLGATAQDMVYLGYLALARDMGLITAAQFTEAFAPPVAEGLLIADVVETFRRTDPATREQFADWLARTMTSANANAFDILGPHTAQQAVYQFGDWNSISPERLQNVELLARTNVMVGNNNVFRPQEYITRMEAAWAGRAIDSILHERAGFQRHFGTVGGIQDGQALTAHTGVLTRDIRVRRDDGHIDVLRFDAQVGGSPQAGIRDAVVLRNGAVGGLGTLNVGDPIEYIVHPETGTVLFVVVSGGWASRSAMGRLQTINDTELTATFMDNYGRAHTYRLAQGLLRREGEVSELRMGIRWYPINQLPYGTLFTIYLVNNMITQIEFAGNFILQPETWGIVIANNPMLGYLTIWDAHGHERTFNYNSGEITVQKREHFDMRDTIGGIHALFPHARVNNLAADISAIEPGNVVSFRLDPADPTMIIAIHASTNYTTRYGRILEFRTYGNMHNFLMEFENGRTSWFTMPDNIMVRREARPVNAATVQVGDWARILINQAILGPGHVMESVRGMELEGDARHITSIVRGQLTGINVIQNQLTLQNAQQLVYTGWGNYRQIASYSLTNPQIEYFYNGNPVSLGFINQNLRHSNVEAYVALESAHGGDRVRMISFRSGRPEQLDPSTVVGVDGQGGFHVLAIEGAINTDPGTIVRRNGRLVTGNQINPWDYAVVTLSGQNSAAVVDISPAPNFRGVQIARGRIQSVDQGQSFRVQSMSLFDGRNWHFTPIEREFSIDHSTLFLNPDGLGNINDFIDFTEDSVVDRVYNIVIDGSRAARVIDAPWFNDLSHIAFRGIIYGIEGENLLLRDVHVRNPQSGVWNIISNVNATATITVPVNSIVVDRDQVVGVNNLQIGQQVRAFTNTPFVGTTIGAGMDDTAYIVLVER